MKNLFFKSLLFLSLILISSCSSSSGADEPEVEEITITMTVNGDLIVFDENQINVSTTTNGGITGGPTVSIQAAISNNQVVTITLSAGITGSNSLEAFELFDSTAGINVQYIPNGNSGFQCGNETLNSSGIFVTTLNDGSQASGAFTLDLEDCVAGAIQTIEITNGVFNVEY